MATPLGHGLVGFLVHAGTASQRSGLLDARRAAALVAAAMAPDLDFALHLLDGRNHHQGASHSLGAAVIVGVLVALGTRWMGGGWGWRMGVLVAVAWASHGLTDFLSQDTRPPLGPELLWPLTSRHLTAPHHVFLYTRRTLEWSTVSHNALAALREALILVPLVLLAAARPMGWGRWRDGAWRVASRGRR